MQKALTWLLVFYAAQRLESHLGTASRATGVITCGRYPEPAHSASDEQALVSCVPDFRGAVL